MKNVNGLGYVACMGATRNACSVLVGKFGGETTGKT